MVLLPRGPRQPHGDGAVARPRPGSDPLTDLLRTTGLQAGRWSPHSIAALLGVIDQGLADARAYGTFLTALLESRVQSRLGRLIRTAPAEGPEVARLGRVGGRVGLDLLLGGCITTGRRELVICIDLRANGTRERLVAARWLQPATTPSSRRTPDLEPTERLRNLVRLLAPVGCQVRWLLTPRTPPRPGNRVGVHPIGRFRIEEAMTAKPAARQGDPTQHGGQLGGGSTKVSLDGMPAATLGDPQQCPLSDGAKAHIGGRITGGSGKVQIGGKAAARAGDPVSCGGGAPNSIAAGSAKVLIG